jgi:hypothetical protein
MLGIYCLVVLPLFGASVRHLRHATRANVPHQGSAERICVIKQGGSDPVSVWRLKGHGSSEKTNYGRAISFGLMPNTTESRVHCLNDEESCALNEEAASDEGVADASACPQCLCEIDDAQALTPSNKVLFDEIVPVCARASKEQPIDVLMLGLGGGSLHRRVRQQCPDGTRIRSVEVDPRVAGVAERYFGVDVVPGVSEVKVADAGAEVQSLASARNSDAGTDAALSSTMGAIQEIGMGGWDLVTVDCFIGKGETPEVCRSKDFITAVQTILKPSGKALQHFWHYSPDRETVAQDYKHAVDDYRETYGQKKVQVLSVMRAPNRRWDDVVVAQK